MFFHFQKTKLIYLLYACGACLLLNSLSFGQEKPQAEDLKQLLSTFHKEFLLIEPGKKNFPKTMSAVNPKTKAKVDIQFRQSFFVAKYEVTQNLWREVMGSNPSRWKGERNSVEMLSYDESVLFCQKVTKLLRAQKLIQKGQQVRLPTELEWEYVVGAGTQTKYSFGDDASNLDDYAWHTGNAKGNDPPVGVKKPNAWGLYDGHGYLWEWTVDSWANDKPLAEMDDSNWPPKKASTILKGGSWKDAAAKLTTRFRLKAERDLKDDAVGLRCILTRPKP